MEHSANQAQPIGQPGQDVGQPVHAEQDPGAGHGHGDGRGAAGEGRPDPPAPPPAEQQGDTAKVAAAEAAWPEGNETTRTR